MKKYESILGCAVIAIMVCGIGLGTVNAQTETYFTDKNLYFYSLGWGCPYGAADLNKQEAQMWIPWLFRKSDGSTISPSSAWTLACFNSPARDYIVERLVKHVKTNPSVSKLFLDAVWWGIYGDEWCCCDYCKQAYRAKFGKDMPIVDYLRWGGPLSSSQMKQAIEWRRDTLEDVYREILAKVKAVRPDIPITIHGITGFYFDSGDLLSRLNHFRLSDIAYVENYVDEKFHQALMRGVAKQPSVMHTPYFNDPWSLQDPLVPYSGDVFKAVVSGLLAHGCYMTSTGVPKGTKNVTSLLELVDKEVNEKRQYVQGASPVLYAAIVYSELTKIYYRRCNQSRSPLPNIQGAWEVMQRLRVPVEFLADMDLDLESLKKFKLVILPNTAILSPPQVTAIRQYVKAGGSILATYETSLYDEFGDIQADFDLSDVFGLKYVGMNRTAGNRIAPAGNLLTHLQDVQSARGGWQDQTLCVYKPFVIAESTSGDTRATYTAGRSPPGPSAIPSIHFNHFGKGKSAYISADLFKEYRVGSKPYIFPTTMRDTLGAEMRALPFINSRMSWITDLTGDVLSWLAPNSPFKLDGPSLIECTFFEQKQKKRIIVHLLNSGVEKVGTAFDLGPARLLIKKDFVKPRKVYSAWPEKMELKVQDKGDYLAVTVPKTRIHQIVVIER